MLPRKDAWRSSNGVVEVESLDFVGSGASSSDGVYMIACRGQGDQTNDDFVLLRNDEVVLHGQMPGRLSEGVVSNNGTFVLEQFATPQTRPTVLWAFDPSGNVLFKRRFNSGVLHMAVSDDGEFCLAHSFPSLEARRETLVLVDLRNCSVVFDKEAACDRVHSYQIDENRHVVIADCGDLGKFTYDFTGKFLERDAYEAAKEAAWKASLKQTWKIEDASAIDLYRMAVVKREQYWDDPSSRDRAVAWLEKALKMGLDACPDYKARAFKILGEALELSGGGAKALYFYEEALKLDPKIGLKRKLAQLKKAG